MNYRKLITQKNSDYEEDRHDHFVIPKDIMNSLRLSQIEKGQIILKGPVDEKMADYVQDALMLLEMEPPKSEVVTVKISSPGGCVLSGLKIHDLLMLYSIETGIPVRGMVIGMACSAASTFLLQGCTQRLATENCMIMCHHALSGLVITEHNLKSDGWRKRLLDNFADTKEKMIRILERRTGKSEQEILKLLVRAREMSTKEAFEFGLIDDIIKFEFKEQEEKPIKRYRRFSKNKGSETE